MNMTINDSEMRKMEQLTYREYLRDGLTEIFIGLLFIVSPVLISNPAFMGFYVLLVIVIIPRVIERIRVRYTYPRLGYAKMKTDDDLKKNLFGTIAFVGIVVIITIIALLIVSDSPSNHENWYKMAPFFYGMILFGPSAMLVDKSGLKRFWLYWSFGLISGLAITILSLDNDDWEKWEGFFLYLGFWGGIMIVFGVIVFLRFLKEYQYLTGELDEQKE